MKNEKIETMCEEQVNLEISHINQAMQKLFFFRGTKEEIIAKLNEIGLRNDCFLEPFEEPLPENDLGFNTNLGEIGDHYLDFEVYLLPTNQKDCFLVTEVNEF